MDIGPLFIDDDCLPVALYIYASAYGPRYGVILNMYCSSIPKDLLVPPFFFLSPKSVRLHIFNQTSPDFATSDPCPHYASILLNPLCYGEL